MKVELRNCMTLKKVELIIISMSLTMSVVPPWAIVNFVEIDQKHFSTFYLVSDFLFLHMYVSESCFISLSVILILTNSV